MKVPGLIEARKGIKFRAIYELHEQEGKYTIKALCSFLNVTEQGYYKYKYRIENPYVISLEDEQIVYDMWIAFNKAIGYKKIALQLRFDYGLYLITKRYTAS